jgi:hypothetical protein
VSGEQQTLNLVEDGGLFANSATQLRHPILLGQIEQFIQQRIDANSLLCAKAWGRW